MDNQSKIKRLASQTIFHERINKGSILIDKAIVFEDHNSGNKYIAVVYSNSQYEVVNLVSNEGQCQGDFLDAIQMSSELEYSVGDSFNTIYKIDHFEGFAFLIIDDKSIHLIDLMANKILSSVPFTQPNNISKQLSENSSFQFQQKNYYKWSNTRKAFVSSCVISMNSQDGRMLMILDRFESQTQPELLILHIKDDKDARNQLVLFRQKLEIKSEQYENGKLISCFIPEMNTIYLTRECFLEEEFVIYQLQLAAEINTVYKLQRITGEKQMFEKVSFSIIDLRQIDKVTLCIFANGNAAGLPRNNLPLSNIIGPQILRYNILSRQFLPSISLHPAEVKESGILSSVLSISEKLILLQFHATTGAFLAIFNKTNNSLQDIFEFNSFQKMSLKFGIMPFFDIQSVSQQGNMSGWNNTDSKLCFFAINSKRNKVKQYYPVGIAESIIYFLRQKGIEEQISEVALHDVIDILGLLPQPKIN